MHLLLWKVSSSAQVLTNCGCKVHESTSSLSSPLILILSGFLALILMIFVKSHSSGFFIPWYCFILNLLLKESSVTSSATSRSSSFDVSLFDAGFNVKPLTWFSLVFDCMLEIFVKLFPFSQSSLLYLFSISHWRSWWTESKVFLKSAKFRCSAACHSPACLMIFCWMRACSSLPVTCLFLLQPKIDSASNNPTEYLSHYREKCSASGALAFFEI